MKKGFLVTLGFVLFALGFLSIIMGMIGLQFSFLTWMDNGGKLTGFVLRIIMLLAGMILMVMAYTDWDREFRESREE